MFVEANGAGPAVLFLHGLGGSSYSWRETWPALAGRYSTYAVDLPGFGPRGLPGQESAPLAENAWSVVGLAGAVRSFILSHGLTAPIVVGHSMGGAVALRLAELAIQAGSGFSIAKMILLAPAAFTPNGAAFAGVLAAMDRTSRARAILQIAYANRAAISSKQVDAYAKGLTDAHLRVFSALALDLPRIVSPPPRFASITTETLVIWGTQDRILPPDTSPPIGGQAKALCAALPHAALAEIQQCGHIPQEEKPAETNATIAAFLL